MNTLPGTIVCSGTIWLRGARETENGLNIKALGSSRRRQHHKEEAGDLASYKRTAQHSLFGEACISNSLLTFAVDNSSQDGGATLVRRGHASQRRLNVAVSL